MIVEQIVTESWWSRTLEGGKSFFRKNLVGIIMFGTIGVSAYVWLVLENETLAWRIGYTGIGAVLFKAFSSFWYF